MDASLRLVNDALVVKLGEDAIANLDDDKLGGLPARLTYERAIRDAFGCYPWSFGKGWVQLGLEADPPGNGWAHAFQLPGDRATPPVKIADMPDLQRHFTAYQILGVKAYSNADALWAMILKKAAPEEWPLPFENAFVTYLASELAESVTGDKERRQILRREACGSNPDTMLGGLFSEAARIDAQNQPSRAMPLGTDRISTARFSL